MGFENKTGLQLRSLIKKSGELELSLVKIAIPEPAADEVVVRVEATPINPSESVSKVMRPSQFGAQEA